MVDGQSRRCGAFPMSWLHAITKRLRAHLRACGGPYCESKQLAWRRTAVQLQFRKRRSMTLDGLTDSTLHRVQLHRALDLESVLSRLAGGGVGRNADENTPLAVRRHTVVDDLVGLQGGMSVKDLRLMNEMLGETIQTQRTFCGDACPSITFQCNTSRSVTMPRVVSLIQDQYVTSSLV